MRTFERAGIREERRALMLAMAQIEAYLLEPKQIDHSKDDFPDKSENVSVFNLNEDMLIELGYRLDASANEKKYRELIRELNNDGALPMVVGLLNQAFDKWGVVKTLCFVRGGRKAFKDGKSYDAHNYLKAVATSLRLMDEDPGWLVDDRRIEMTVVHQTHQPKATVAGTSATARH
jgi:hypothetical protein